MQNAVQKACQPWCLGLLFRKARALRNSDETKKIRCNFAPLCYSLLMQDDFTTQVQSDEFASEWEAMRNAADFVAEFNAYLDEMEKKYWQEIGNRGN